MMAELYEFLKSIIQTAWSMLDSSSTWVIFSFIVAGLLHEFIKPEQMQKTAIGSTKFTGLLWSTLTGMMLPICSCGTIPLGISMYYSGAYLGPTLTFMTSTPMINPLAVVMSWGLLGPQITIIYVITGFVAPMLIGTIANKFAGSELHIGLRNKKYGASEVSIKLEMDEEEDDEETSIGGMIQLEFEEPSFWDKIKTGLRWSATELSVTVSKYSITGMLMAGFLFTIIPQSFIHDYLGQPGVISLVGIAIVAALMYV